MNLLHPQLNSIGINCAIFAGSAALVWIGGTRLAGYAKTISERTGGGQAFIGTLLLGGIVSLPEMVMAVAASAAGSAALAVNILLGGVAITMVVLAVTDAVVGDEALSTDVQKPVVLLQGALVVLLLTVTAAGITARDVPVPVLGAGVWSTTLAALYVIGLVFVRRSQEKEPWRPTEARPSGGETAAELHSTDPPRDGRSVRSVVYRTVVAGLAVVVGGIASARTADALAVQTGLGAKFVGFVLGGCVTSLPELSSTVAATRLRQYEMAFADAFGTNLCSLALLFLADLVYAGQPVLNEVGQFSLFATLLGIALTTTYLAGLIVRPKRSRLRMGIDSIVVLCISAFGFILLYRLR